MGRRRPIDWVNWKLYRRAWVLCALALLLVVATSFHPQQPPQSQLPPSVSNTQAAYVIAQAQRFDDQYPDRRAGRPGSIDAAQWVRRQFEALGLHASTVPTTTTAAGNRRPVSLVNVEGELRGRTNETVVVVAHRDNSGLRDPGNDPVGTAALLKLAEQLQSTRDRRRTYLLVSTDGAALNGGGARLLAQRLRRRSGQVVAIVVLDRLGSGDHRLHVPIVPGGQYAPPLGLSVAARAAVAAEGGSSDGPVLVAQLLRLGAPVTLWEQGQLLRHGLPSVTLTAANERAGRHAPRNEPATVGSGLRSLERLLGTIDTVDSLQSAGKTHLLGDQRVYRGWALKILVASMLVPFWVGAVDLFVRLRRRWNIVGAVGSIARAMLAGIWAVAVAWLLSAIGLLPAATDRPPNPSTVDGVHFWGGALWLLLAGGGWLLTRAPDWRRAHVQGRDHAVLAVGMLALGVLAGVALAANPYVVLFSLPALHGWLWLSSRHVHERRDMIAVWCTGLVGPLIAGLLVARALDLGPWAPSYWAALVTTRTVPPALALLGACGAGIGLLLLFAAIGSVGRPVLPRVRRAARSGGLQQFALAARPRLTRLAARPRRTSARPRPAVRKRVDSR